MRLRGIICLIQAKRTKTILKAAFHKRLTTDEKHRVECTIIILFFLMTVMYKLTIIPNA